MRVVVDMNLSPLWCDTLAAAGHDAVHWSAVGAPGAADDVIMAWARAAGRAVLTHDLDFGAILWATKAAGPSVIQLRGDDVLPDTMGPEIGRASCRERV